MEELSNLCGVYASGRSKRSRKTKRKLPREDTSSCAVLGKGSAPVAPRLSSTQTGPETAKQDSSLGKPPSRDGGGLEPEGQCAGVCGGPGLLPRWLDPVMLMVVISAIYARTLHHSFHFDDKVAIWDNPIILAGISWTNVQEIFSSNRPVSILSFALNYYFGGLETAGYHLANIAIHAVTTVLLYLFISLTLQVSSATEGKDSRAIAFFSSLLWAVHPLQVQSVTYIVQRMSSMAAMFFLATMICYVGARRTASLRNRWLLTAMSVCFGMLAVASKENAAILPMVVFFYELYFFRDFDLSWLKGKTMMIIGLSAGLFGGWLFLSLGKTMVWNLLSGSWGYSNWNFTMGQRLLTEARVVIFYLGLFLFPNPGRLNLDHDIAISTSLLTPPTTLFSIVLLLVLAGWSIARARRERLFSFCILWFFLCLAIESSFIGIEISYEHRMYLPSMLTSLLLVLALYRFLRLRRLRVVIVCGLVLVCAYWTVVRNVAWATEISLWSDCVKKSPGRARAHVSLAYGYLKEARYDEAIKSFQEAVTIDPANSDYLNDLSYALLRAGKTEESIDEAQKAIQLDPFNAMAHFNLGCSYEKNWQLQKALQSYSEALRLSLHPDIRAERRVDPAKASPKVESMKQMIRAMEERQKRG